MICPICLTPIEDWDALPRWQWNQSPQAYTELKIPAGISGPQLINMQRGSAKLCPNPYQFNPKDHYLPADYGSFGPPVVLGFVGLTKSGKTHLLTTMVGAMLPGLRQYGIDCWALDRALHNQFLEQRVRPLLNDNKVLRGTDEGIVAFSDAFLMKLGKGQPRPVVMFDVAGGDLTGATQTKKFLDIADGLFFVVDPTQIGTGGIGDDTFNNVLDLLRGANRLPDHVSAAIVLNKADPPPLRGPGDPLAAIGHRGTPPRRSSLARAVTSTPTCRRKARPAWTLPYEECARATLHVASPTGGVGQGEGKDGVFPRGVTPRRVLRPLVAMLRHDRGADRPRSREGRDIGGRIAGVHQIEYRWQPTGSCRR